MRARASATLFSCAAWARAISVAIWPCVQAPLRGERGDVGRALRCAWAGRAPPRRPRPAVSRLRAPPHGRRAHARSRRGRSAPLQLRSIASLSRGDAVEVVEVRDRLVEALRAEHDLERLDGASFVEEADPLRELTFADPRAATRRLRSAPASTARCARRERRLALERRDAARAPALRCVSSEYRLRTAARDFASIAGRARAATRRCARGRRRRPSVRPVQQERWPTRGRVRRRSVCACPSTAWDRTTGQEKELCRSCRKVQVLTGFPAGVR